MPITKLLTSRTSALFLKHTFQPLVVHFWYGFLVPYFFHSFPFVSYNHVLYIVRTHARNGRWKGGVNNITNRYDNFRQHTAGSNFESMYSYVHLYCTIYLPTTGREVEVSNTRLHSLADLVLILYLTI